MNISSIYFRLDFQLVFLALIDYKLNYTQLRIVSLFLCPAEDINVGNETSRQSIGEPPQE